MKCETATLQHDGEMARFIDILKREGVRSYLEIGSKFGGSLWRVGNTLPPGSRIVCVDLPQGDGSPKETRPHLIECHEALRARGYDAHQFLGDSTDTTIIDAVRKLGPFDACLIDANHTETYVRADWENYGSLCRIVAFHDIGWLPRPEPSKKMPIDVPKVWNEIKASYRHEEIRECPRDNGIGVLWRN